MKPVVFPITPASNRPRIFLAAAGVVMLGIPVFFWVSAPGAPIFSLILGTAIPLGILLVLGTFVYAASYARFEVTPEELAIRGDIIYGRRLPAAALLPGEARVVDLEVNEELRLKWRTNGAGLPGYGSGWFRLGNGGKALVFVTDRRRVVHLPTRQGFSLLLSVQEPEAFLKALGQGPQPQN